MIKEAELQQAYNLGRQAAREKLASTSIRREVQALAIPGLLATGLAHIGAHDARSQGLSDATAGSEAILAPYRNAFKGMAGLGLLGAGLGSAAGALYPDMSNENKERVLRLLANSGGFSDDMTLEKFEANPVTSSLKAGGRVGMQLGSGLGTLYGLLRAHEIPRELAEARRDGLI